MGLSPAGAVLMWLHFLPHFKTLPEPPPDAREDQLLRRRDAYREDQMAIASYNTRSDRKVSCRWLLAWLRSHRYAPVRWRLCTLGTKFLLLAHQQPRCMLRQLEDAAGAGCMLCTTLIA